METTNKSHKYNLKLYSIHIKECKGEMVIIMEGYTPEEQPTLSMSDLMQIVDRYVEAGMSAKDAIKRTAQENGVSKNEVYRNYFN